MIRILHAADLHLDSPFEGLPEEKAALRRSEQRELLRSLAQLRAETGAQLVLLAGDLFDSAAPGPAPRRRSASRWRRWRCPSSSRPATTTVSNPAGAGRGSALPENVHVFTSAQPKGVELPELGVQVWGAAFTDTVSGPLLRGFSARRRPGRTLSCSACTARWASPPRATTPYARPSSPQAAWTTPPSATSTPSAACAAPGTASTPGPAAPRAGASTRPATRASSSPTLSRGREAPLRARLHAALRAAAAWTPRSSRASACPRARSGTYTS